MELWYVGSDGSVNDNWFEVPPPPPPPAQFISVSKEGGGSAVFIVTGEGFTPNSLVAIKITATNFDEVQFGETTGRDGKFVSRYRFPITKLDVLIFT